MDGGYFYGLETTQVEYEVDQEYLCKTETDYDAFPGVGVMLKGDGVNEKIVKAEKNE